MTRPALAELMGKKPRRDEEAQLQMAIIDHLMLRARKDILFWHCPNGMQRTKAAAGKLKALGVRPGIPDLQFMFPDGHVAFIEIKVQGGKLSPAQTDFALFCDRAGVEFAAVWSIDQALAVLEAWGIFK